MYNMYLLFLWVWWVSSGDSPSPVGGLDIISYLTSTMAIPTHPGNPFSVSLLHTSLPLPLWGSLREWKLLSVIVTIKFVCVHFCSSEIVCQSWLFLQVPTVHSPEYNICFVPCLRCTYMYTLLCSELREGLPIVPEIMLSQKCTSWLTCTPREV